jgi:hypothetical protein
VLNVTANDVSTHLRSIGFNVEIDETKALGKDEIYTSIKSEQMFSVGDINAALNNSFVKVSKNEYWKNDTWFTVKVIFSEPVKTNGYMATVRYIIKDEEIMGALFEFNRFFWILFNIYVTFKVLVWLNER